MSEEKTIRKRTYNGYIEVPKALFRDPRYIGLCAEAKLLYGFLYDRRTLSIKNGDDWVDENGRVYIYYPLTEVAERMGCGHDKASSLMAALEKVKLIERTRQGRGKPCRVVVNDVFENSNSRLSGNWKISASDIEKTESNKNDTNNLEEMNPYSHVMCNRQLVKSQLKENLNYDVLAGEMEQITLDKILSVIVDTICTPNKSVRISGENKTKQDVCDRFMALTDMHIRYVYDRLMSEQEIIYSPKGYLLKHLYEAEFALDIYYQSCVAFDEKNRRYE